MSFFGLDHMTSGNITETWYLSCISADRIPTHIAGWVFAGDANKFTFRAAVVDNRGQSYSLPFCVPPDFRILPDDVFKSYRTYDPETQKTVIVKYNVMWNGGLNAGEIREIELATAEGPYLPEGTSIHVRIERMEKKGDTAVVRTPDQPIQRAD